MLTGTGMNWDTAERRRRVLARRPPVSAMLCFVLVALAGAWLLISPRVLPYPTGTPRIVSDSLSGLLLVILAPASIVLVRRFHGLGWGCVLVGGWILASLLFLPDTMTSPAVMWNEILVGALALELAGWATDATPAAPHEEPKTGAAELPEHFVTRKPLG